MSKIRWPTITITISIIVVLWIVFGWIYPRYQGEPGIFGDQFGAINALFSGMALAGIIIALWLQREELQLQRQELDLTRQEIAGQKNALLAQSQTMQIQQFESSFYNLLEFIRIKSNHIRFGVDNGTMAFRAIDFHMRNNLTNTEIGKLLDKNELYWATNVDTDLSSFMELVIEILHYIRSNTLISNSRHYIQVVNSTLSRDQKRILFYWALQRNINAEVRTALIGTQFFSEADLASLHKDEHRSLLA